MIDPLVFDRKATFMQRIADFVRTGYRYWTAGEVPPERVRALVRKFSKLYGTDQTRHQRAYSKAKGDGCAVLLLYAPHTDGLAHDTAPTEPHTAFLGPHTASLGQHAARSEPSTARLRWILLVSPGSHPAHHLERLQDANQATGRITLTGYELVLLPRAGQQRPAWTWRMQEATYQGWRLRLIAAARRNLGLLENEVMHLRRTPGFAGCRVQGKKLLLLARREFGRRFPQAPALTMPRLPYLQRLADTGIVLSAWLRRYTRQTSCAANTGVEACHTEP